MAELDAKVDSGRVSGAPVADWRRLFDVAAKIRKLDPWQWMTLGHLFGVQLYGMKEPEFVLFSELASNSQRIVAVFSGWMAFRVAFANNSDHKRPILERTVEESWVRLVFGSADGLNRSDKAILNRLGLYQEGLDEYPMFCSQRIGYFPDHLSADEVVSMREVLYQAYGMALRIESNLTMTQERLPQTFFVRVQQADGSWEDAWLDEPVHERHEIDVGLEGSYINRLQQLTGSEAVFQINLLLTPLRTKSKGNHRSEAVFTLLVVERQTGSMVCCEVLQAIDGVAAMWAKIPGVVLRAIDEFGAIPAEIEVCRDMMFDALRPLSELLPFKLRSRNKLEAIDGMVAEVDELF